MASNDYALWAEVRNGGVVNMVLWGFVSHKRAAVEAQKLLWAAHPEWTGTYITNHRTGKQTNRMVRPPRFEREMMEAAA